MRTTTTTNFHLWSSTQEITSQFSTTGQTTVASGKPRLLVKDESKAGGPLGLPAVHRDFDRVWFQVKN